MLTTPLEYLLDSDQTEVRFEREIMSIDTGFQIDFNWTAEIG